MQERPFPPLSALLHLESFSLRNIKEHANNINNNKSKPNLMKKVLLLILLFLSLTCWLASASSISITVSTYWLGSWNFSPSSSRTRRGSSKSQLFFANFSHFNVRKARKKTKLSKANHKIHTLHFSIISCYQDSLSPLENISRMKLISPR